MRILIINQPFWPDVVATAQLMADWTADLAARGHTVTVIASRSVYGKAGAPLAKTDEHRGVRIYRVGSNLFRKGRILTRLVDFGLFHLRSFFKALALPRQDVVVCLTTPPFIGAVGLAMKTLRRSRYIQYEMDLYPDVPIALGVMKPHGVAAWLFERVHRRLLKSADRVIVLGRCMQKVIEAKGIAAAKLALVTPWADPEEIRPVPANENSFRKAHNLAGKFVVMYAGNLGLGHDIATILAAVIQLKGDARIHFVFVGGGRRMGEVQAAVQAQSLANVTVLDYVPREAIAPMLSAADVHLITQAPGTSGLIVPSKFYGILAAGRPAIYIGPYDTEIALTMMESNIGRVLAVGDTAGLVVAIGQLRDWPTAEQTIRAVLHQGHTRDQCVEKLSTLVESLDLPTLPGPSTRAL